MDMPARIGRLVVASNNPGKLHELAALLAPLGIDAIAQDTLGIDEADEPHATFVENALAKARHASAACGLPALADDSGLCVDALGGAPGVRSARFAAEATRSGAPLARAVQDTRNNARLVAALADARVRNPSRAAHYVCVLVLVRAADDPEPIVAAGRWDGSIVDEPRGSNGFGYDPHFVVDGLGLTAAELDPATKNRTSHRAVALRRLVAALDGR